MLFEVGIPNLVCESVNASFKGGVSHFLSGQCDLDL